MSLLSKFHVVQHGCLLQQTLLEYEINTCKYLKAA